MSLGGQAPVIRVMQLATPQIQARLRSETWQLQVSIPSIRMLCPKEEVSCWSLCHAVQYKVHDPCSTPVSPA